MRKVKYFYNSQTLRYERLVTRWYILLGQALGWLAAAAVTVVIIISVGFKYVGSPREKVAMKQLNDFKENYTLLAQRFEELKGEVASLRKRDNEIYRQIFEADPLPDSASKSVEETNRTLAVINNSSADKMIRSISQTLNRVTEQIKIQTESYKEIADLIKNKQRLLEAIPAIQPVSNKELTRMASGFGYRIDPIYKIKKFHAGLDFAAPRGTPIYATANGTIQTADYAVNGFGNHVIINHGYGYQTLYGHLVKIKVRTGEKVNRGQVIGWVGSTGKSTGPHCHYEVLLNHKTMNPVYFFYNDLTPEQYDRLLKLSSAENQSLD